MGKVRSWIAVVVMVVGLGGEVWADFPIYCPATLDVVYYYRGDYAVGSVMMPEDFEPAKPGVPRPRVGGVLVCEDGKTPINGWRYWYYQRGLSMPRMAYNAVTLLTKVGGEFVWVPDEVSIGGEGITLPVDIVQGR